MRLRRDGLTTGSPLAPPTSRVGHAGGGRRYQVLEASSVDGALEILAEHHASIRLLLTDVDMPGRLNGMELANKAHVDWQNIDIVICSARHAPVDGELPPPVMFLGKPIDRMTLMQKAQQIAATPRPGYAPA